MQLPVLRKTTPFFTHSWVLLQKLYFVSNPFCLVVLWFVDLLKGYTSPEGSASSLACYIPITGLNIYTAAQFWLFDQASANSKYGDLNQWDVAKVTYMSSSKSNIYLDLTRTDFMLLRLEGLVVGLGWWWWCDVKMEERWRWSIREIECTPMTHCDNICGLWLTVIFL